MSRLPIPGSDSGRWGDILNDFLIQSHNSNGTLKDNIVTADTISDGTVSESLLDAGVQAKLNSGSIADGSITNVKVSGSANIAQSKIANLASDLAAKAPLSSVDGTLVAVSGNDVAGAVSTIVAAGSGILYVPRGHTVSVSTTTALPNEVIGVRIDGDIICTADVDIFTRTGLVTGTSTNITAAILAGQRTVSVSGGTGSLAVGDWVFVVSSVDTLPTTTDKLGYLRQVKSLPTSTSITFDTAFPRNMTDSSRRYRQITLAKPINFYGTGSISYSNPSAFSATMLRFLWCEGVTISEGLTLRDGGGNCVRLSHVAGFSIRARIDNFLDNVSGTGTAHVGYGVNAEGGTRDGYVGGRISRCRHAFTTNVGPSTPEFNFYGEPENIFIEPITRDCTDKALDSHRAGWGLVYKLNDKGSGGGLQIRADTVTLLGGVTEGNFLGSGISVRSGLIVPPNIGPTTITDVGGTDENGNPASAIYVGSDAYITSPRIYRCSGPGIRTMAGAAAFVTGGMVDGNGDSGATGLDFAGSGSRISGFRILNCGIGYNEAAGAANNQIDVEYSGCTTNEVRALVYNRRHAAVAGEAVTAMTTKVGAWIAPASAAALTTSSHAVGTLTFAPIDIPDGTKIDRAAAEVSTGAASSSLRLGIYYSGPDGAPGALYTEFGTISAVSAAVVETSTFSSTLTLTGGRYWLAALGEGTGTVSTRRQQCLGSFGSTSADAISSLRGAYLANGVTTGALPATAPALTTSSSPTRIAVRVA